PPPRSTLFPYTTLFRSKLQAGGEIVGSALFAITPDLTQGAHFERRRGVEPGLLAPIARHDRQLHAALARHRGEFVYSVTPVVHRSEEHTSELQSPCNLV